MAILKTTIDTQAEVYEQNKIHYLHLIERLNQITGKVAEGGGAQSARKHRAKGKLLPRERVIQLLDPDSPLLELSPLAAHQVYQDKVPGAGLITCIGLIHSRPVMIIANDATVKGGTYYPLTVKKHLRAQSIAQKQQLPCIYLVDSGGAYLPKQDEVFPDRDHFGRIFYNQARMSAQGLTQISVVLGMCIAGGAYIPAMSDETIMVKNQSTIYLAGPELVKAATGEVVDQETLGGAKMHTSVSGVADKMVNSDEQAIKYARKSIEYIAAKPESNRHDYAPPLYPAEQLYGILGRDLSSPVDAREIIARLVDSSEFHEFKPDFGTSLLTGFASIKGFKVGILANNGVLFCDSAQKGSHFIQLCQQRHIPLLFLQNITGFMVGKHAESQGIAKYGAQMVNAVACANVPKLTLIFGCSFGAGNYGMCGRAFEPDFLWTWPNSRISVMGGKQAAFVLSQLSAKANHDHIHELYQQQSDPYYASARLWDDGILDPLHTRDTLGFALDLVYQQQPTQAEQSQGYGIFRM